MNKIEDGPGWHRKSNIFVNCLAISGYVGAFLLIAAVVAGVLS